MKFEIDPIRLYEKFTAPSTTSEEDALYQMVREQMQRGEEWRGKTDRTLIKTLRGEKLILPAPLTDGLMEAEFDKDELLNIQFYASGDCSYKYEKRLEVPLEHLFKNYIPLPAGGYILDGDSRPLFSITRDCMPYFLKIAAGRKNGTTPIRFAEGIEDFTQKISAFERTINAACNAYIDVAVQKGSAKSNPQLILNLEC